MQNAQGRSGEKQNVIAHSATWVSNVGGAVVSFFGTPVLFNTTSGMIESFTRNNYAQELSGIAVALWGLLVAASLFFVTRLLLATGIVRGWTRFQSNSI